MRIDWIIAIFMFLMFSVWAFSYYGFMNTSEAAGKGEQALRASGKIASYMQSEFRSNVANISSDAAHGSAVLWARMNWTGEERNSTRVAASRFSGSSLPCMISGDRLYWQAGLEAGENFFYIERLDRDMPMQCSASLPEGDGNQTTLWPTAALEFMSEGGNLQACTEMNTDYERVKAAAKTSMDFSVLMDNGTEMICGMPIPPGRDIYSFPLSGRLWEGGSVKITVRLW